MFTNDNIHKYSTHFFYIIRMVFLSYHVSKFLVAFTYVESIYSYFTHYEYYSLCRVIPFPNPSSPSIFSPLFSLFCMHTHTPRSYFHRRYRTPFTLRTKKFKHIKNRIHTGTIYTTDGMTCRYKKTRYDTCLRLYIKDYQR